MKPLLRWAGGKQWLSERISQMVPANAGTYYEPFFGGGSVFFQVLPAFAILSDLNSRLIEAYRAVRDMPLELISALELWPNDESTFYQVRSKDYNDQVHRAAQLIYLNRTCWNGLYRVNRTGKFNVPFGHHGRRVFDASHLLNVSQALSTVRLYEGDFAAIVRSAQPRDFIYLDPPYAKIGERNGFLKYNDRIFGWDDQRRLGDTAVELADRGCTVVVTNAGYRPILDFYPGFCYEFINRSSVLAADPNFRNTTTELLIYSPA